MLVSRKPTSYAFALLSSLQPLLKALSSGDLCQIAPSQGESLGFRFHTNGTIARFSGNVANPSPWKEYHIDQIGYLEILPTYVHVLLEEGQRPYFLGLRRSLQ